MEKQLITMTKKEAGRHDIIKNLINKKIDGTQASIQLNLSVRQTKRLKNMVFKELFMETEEKKVIKKQTVN